MCRTKSEFNELCVNLQTQINDAGVQPLFEIAKTGYTPWVSQMTQAEMDIQASGSLQEGKSMMHRMMVNGFFLFGSLARMEVMNNHSE